YLCLLRAQATTTALYARSLHDALPISGRVEPLGVHRWHRAAGRAEQHQGAPGAQAGQAGVEGALADPVVDHVDPAAVGEVADLLDRKSTRLNSSHVKISYAVFCLKKKS